MEPAAIDADVLAFVRAQRWAVEATAGGTGASQAAIVGIAVTDRLELVFDTLASSRKAANLRSNPRIALVVGGWNESDPRHGADRGNRRLPRRRRTGIVEARLLRRVPGRPVPPVVARHQLRARHADVASLQRLPVRATRRHRARLRGALTRGSTPRLPARHSRE